MHSIWHHHILAKVVKEIGSGVNDSRPKFLALLENQSIQMIFVEHKDRSTRFGFRHIETLLRGQGRSIEAVYQLQRVLQHHTKCSFQGICSRE